MVVRGPYRITVTLDPFVVEDRRTIFKAAMQSLSAQSGRNKESEKP
jgi:hypothetical protein